MSLDVKRKKKRKTIKQNIKKRGGKWSKTSMLRSSLGKVSPAVVVGSSCLVTSSGVAPR